MTVLLAVHTVCTHAHLSHSFPIEILLGIVQQKTTTKMLFIELLNLA